MLTEIIQNVKHLINLAQINLKKILHIKKSLINFYNNEKNHT